MSHREDCLVSTVEEAREWLSRYRHTLGFDPKAAHVIEILESGQSEALQEAESELARVQDDLEHNEKVVEERRESLERVIGLAESFQETDFDELDLDNPDVAEYQKIAFQLSCDIIKEANVAL